MEKKPGDVSAKEINRMKRQLPFRLPLPDEAPEGPGWLFSRIV